MSWVCPHSWTWCWGIETTNNWPHVCTAHGDHHPGYGPPRFPFLQGLRNTVWGCCAICGFFHSAQTHRRGRLIVMPCPHMVVCMALATTILAGLPACVRVALRPFPKFISKSLDSPMPSLLLGVPTPTPLCNEQACRIVFKPSSARIHACGWAVPVLAASSMGVSHSRVDALPV